MMYRSTASAFNQQSPNVSTLCIDLYGLLSKMLDDFILITKTVNDRKILGNKINPAHKSYCFEMLIELTLNYFLLHNV